jgi:hypothetical protein
MLFFCDRDLTAFHIADLSSPERFRLRRNAYGLIRIFGMIRQGGHVRKYP